MFFPPLHTLIVAFTLSLCLHIVRANGDEWYCQIGGGNTGCHLGSPPRGGHRRVA
ncbi:hypothetical protein D9613_004288 [Agrocybe pediades]|uniref:Uncharacterized protein n=1 Tax=Agrocybe pediades TaxID=84607 RepID=A0A8H4QIP1_9AGAR|nr:hypothetical protein D9613_004288 [Agrocybe pediades]